jgi:hypothetical protein
MLSLYTSLYNLSNGLYDWQKSLENFSNIGDEVVIATTSDCQDNTIDLLEGYCFDNKKCKLVVTDIKFSDYSFDGRLKDVALKKTSFPGKILLDADEMIDPSQKKLWIDATNQLYQSNFDCILIPSINLCKSIYTFKDISYKFYLHKEGLNRGVVNYAKLSNGKIDITKSDTTDIIDNMGNLAKCFRFPNEIDYLIRGDIPYVFHFYAVDLENRVKKNTFWKPHWQNRAGYEITDIELNKENLDKIPVFEHGLPMSFYN